MKSVLSFACLVVFLSLNAQRFDKFTEKEKTAITNSPEMMRVLNLINLQDSIVLTSTSKTIKPNHRITRMLADKMIATVQNPMHQGVGIAAPQVGINRRMIVVQRFDKAEKPFEVFINPEIIWQSNLMQKGLEGDLSFEERAEIYRNYSIQIQYYNLKGKVLTELMEGFTAVIFQHEKDHLDGVLLTDRKLEQQKESWENATLTQDLYFQNEKPTNSTHEK